MNEKNWDDISIDYDLSVEKNKDPVIVNYLQKEMNVVGQLCRKVLKNNNNQCSVIEMGSGTGRAMFSLNNMLNNTSTQFYGIEISKHMIKRANEKKSFYSENQNIRFMMHDSTDSGLCELFTSNTANIVMCLYNTIGVIHPDKRTTFIDNMLRLAGKKECHNFCL